MEYSAQQLRYGLTLAIVANIIWGLAALFWIETKPVDAIDVVAHRAIWSLPIALMIVLLTGRLRSTWALMRVPSTFFWSLLAAALLSMNWGVFVYAVTVGRATEASLGYFMLPLLTIAVGRLVFHETLGTTQRLAIALAIFAVGIQLFSYGALPWISLVVSISFALYGVIRKKIAADTIQGLFIETLCMSPFALAWLWITGGGGVGIHGWRVDTFLLLAGVYTTAPLLTYIAAARLLPLSVVGYTSYLGPSLQLLVAQTVLGETIDVVTMVSFSFVWLGVLLVSGGGLVRMRRRGRAMDP
ncbi:EamA family transporter RarD [Luminiphilus sp.]|nr:EamA family transporter RarD [Luminiphilus sp.]MCH1581204.1 EamA family transporter RarD [Luminiphilus sp.]MDA8619340.1 EamA family transporter RarD [Luminiphilus sp.]MDC0572187.1 EamA family transporter RarD [Luminiphilus sp.]